MQVTKRLLIISAIIFAITLHINLASACSCAWTSPETMIGNNDLVFTGKVVSVEKPLIAFPQNQKVKVELLVNQVWKGKSSNLIEVHTQIDSAACGIEFFESTEYLVFARLENGKYHTSLCSGTSSVESSESTINFLGKPKMIFENTGLETNQPKGTGPFRAPENPVVLPLFLLILVVSFGFLTLYEQKRRDENNR